MPFSQTRIRTKTWSLKIAKTRTQKIETWSNSILNYRNFAKGAIHFGQMLTKFWSKFSLKLVNLKTWWVLGQFSETRKTWTRKNLGILKPKKLKPKPLRSNYTWNWRKLDSNKLYWSTVLALMFYISQFFSFCDISSYLLIQSN